MTGEWNPIAQAFGPVAPTLADFLLARIAEDETDAKRLHEAYERDEPRPPARLVAYRALVIPARVLAECEAKRRIVEEHALFVNPVGGLDHCRMCVRPGGYGQVAWTEEEQRLGGSMLGIRFPCPTLRALALPYADHPDYREEEWAL